MANALQQVGINLGYDYSLDFYKKLTWAGSLEETIAFENEFTAYEQIEINYIGEAEKYNEPAGYSPYVFYPKGNALNEGNANCN